jgi:hypothetical protein
MNKISEANADEETQEQKRVCSACVGEVYLSDLIDKTGTKDPCAYCDGEMERRAITIAALADYIESAFERHYVRTPTDPDDYEYMLLKDKESSYDWERHGEEVVWAITNAADVEEAIATDVLDILEDRYANFEAAKLGEECEFADSDEVARV